MTKKQLKQRLIDIRNGALITPHLEAIWNERVSFAKSVVPEGLNQAETTGKLAQSYVSGYNTCRSQILAKIEEAELDKSN